MSSTNEIKNFHDEVVDFMQRGGTSVPLASASLAGIVKVGNGLSITGDGTLSCSVQGGGGSYPIASASALGVIKVGNGLSINSSTGVLSIATGVILNTVSSTVEGAMWYIP